MPNRPVQQDVVTQQTRVVQLRTNHYRWLRLLEYPPNVTKETVLDRVVSHVAGGLPFNTPLVEVVPNDAAWGVPWYTLHRAVRSNLEFLDDQLRAMIGGCITAGFQVLQNVVAPSSDVTGICVIVALGTQSVEALKGPAYELAYLLHGGELTGLADSICPERRFIGM